MSAMSATTGSFHCDERLLYRCRVLCDSFACLLGRPLLPDLPQDDHALVRALYDAPVVIVSHGNETDPVFWFANRIAQQLWEMDWPTFTSTPSRKSVAADEHADREVLLRRAHEQGYIDDYRGVRISAGGRRFRIENVVFWNLTDRQGVHVGQAAVFAQWTWL